MDYRKESNGNITFIVGDSRDELELIKDRVGGDDVKFLSQMMDMAGWIGNAVFTPIRPENVGALTDAPMFTNVAEYQEDGSLEVAGDVWWFPNYQVENFAETLLDKGEVTFTLASY